jgi:hypothetical protein
MLAETRRFTPQCRHAGTADSGRSTGGSVMSHRLAAACAAMGLLAFTPLPSEAGDRQRGNGWGHGGGHHRGYGHAPGQWVHPQYGPSYRAPAYDHAPRPPRVYYAPPPVYYARPPVYYAPPPVYYAPRPAYPSWGYPQGEVTFGLRVPVR